MKTEEWIDALAAGTESVDPRAPARRLLLATLAGAALALPLMLGLLGLNPRLATASQTPMFWVKLAFVATTAAAASALLHRLARPSVPIQRNAMVLAMPFAAIWLLAAAALIASAATERLPLLLGSTWNACPVNIAMLSAPALVLILWALRSLAPTRLRLAGAPPDCWPAASGRPSTPCTAPRWRRRSSAPGMCWAC